MSSTAAQAVDAHMMAGVENATNVRRRPMSKGCSMLSESYDTRDESIVEPIFMATVIFLLLLVVISLWVIVHGSPSITVPLALGWMYGKSRPQ